MIKLFCNEVDKEVKNFWNHIVFHPTNAIEKDWGKQQLDKMAEDNAVRIVRIYTMFETSVTEDEKGQMHFDFTLNDQRIDYLLEKGFTPYIVYGFLPEFLGVSSAEEHHRDRYDGDYLYVTYCNDYKKWEEICRVYTQHIVDRYGEDQVASWYMHCYNEPDSANFFYGYAPDVYDRADKFVDLYEAYVKGVTSVSEKLMVGAMGLSEALVHMDFLDHFLGKVKERNLRFDMLSYHSYGTCPQQIEDQTRPVNALGSIRNTMIVKQIAKRHGFENLPMACDEWGIITAGYAGIARCKEMDIREDERCAVYFAKLLTHCDNIGLTDPMFFCLSGAHNLKEDFAGHRNFFSKSFYPKPIYNAYVLANRLGNQKLYYFTNKRYQDVSIMPTKHDDGHLSLLMSYGDDGFTRPLADLDVQIDLTGLEGEYSVKLWRIDKNHANAYTKFLELGSPQDATEAQKETIRAAGALQAEDLGTVSPENNILRFDMINNATVLVELYPNA